jgi:hypothetical protein
MGGSNRRRSRNQSPDSGGEAQRSTSKNSDTVRYDKNRGLFIQRPKWSPPMQSNEPLVIPNCAHCGRIIRDITTALEDQITKEPVHFDCVMARLAETETLEKGDSLAYIGGGRFAVVHLTVIRLSSHYDIQTFKIKKIVEWEDKEHKAEWRQMVSDHYSVT